MNVADHLLEVVSERATLQQLTEYSRKADGPRAPHMIALLLASRSASFPDPAATLKEDLEAPAPPRAASSPLQPCAPRPS